MTSARQHGFALATVLLILLMLALLVAALLSNQTLALRETSNVLTAATRLQESHNVHRTCLQKVRQALTAPANNDWRDTFEVTANTVKGTCIVEANATADVSKWTPQLRISTTVDGQTEISDWRYPSCGNETVKCFTATSSLKIKLMNTSDFQTLTPVYLLDADVETGWRKQ